MSITRTIVRSLLPLFTLAPLAACSSAPTARRLDQVMVGKNKKIEVEILGSVLQKCNIPSDRAYFDFGEAGLDDADRVIVEELADCMTDGPLAGHAILITGYTDEIGDRRSNDNLGLARSEAVAFELNAQGVPAKRIYVRSRGERDADKNDPQDLKYDRKVVLSLIEKE